MILYIDTLAHDKTAAAMGSLTDYTAAATLDQLTLGDSEPLELHFLTAASTYASWVADASYVISAGIGAQTYDGSGLYSSTSTFITGATSRDGRLSLSTSAMREAMQVIQGTTKKGVLMSLQIRVTNPAGYTETVALLSIFVLAQVMLESADDVSVVSTDVRYVTAPATSTSTGAHPSFATDAFYFYATTATDVWVRVPLGSW